MTESGTEAVSLLSLDETIDTAEIILETSPCDKYSYSVLKYLTKINSLRCHAQQLQHDLDSTREKLKDLQRDAAVSMDEDIHIRVEISQFRKRWIHANRITTQGWSVAMKLENTVEMLRDVIRAVAYEAALGFFLDER